MTSEPGPRVDAEPGPVGPAVDGAAPAGEDERRMHPAWVLAKGIHELRGFLPAFIGLAVGLRGWAVPVALLIVLAELGLLTLRWRTTRYAVVDGALRLRSGLLSRSERVIPATRISALDTTRGIVQRAFGLVSLEVQTAGGGRKAELRLDALSAEEAERLRGVLGHARALADEVHQADAAPAPAPASWTAETAPNPRAGEPAPASRAGEPAPAAPPATRARTPWAPVGADADDAPVVYAITGRDLVIAALTGPQIGLVAVVVGSVFSQAGDLLPRGLKNRAEDVVTGADATTVVTLVVLAVLFAAALSVMGTVLAFAEFTVLRDDRRLRVRRGLLTERTGTIPLDRVHGVRIVEGLLRRPLGYATVLVEVAGYGVGDETMRTLVPLVRRRDLPALLGRVLPELPWPAGELRRPPARARRRYWTVPVLWSLVPAAAAAIWLPDALKAVAVVPVVVAAALGDSRWRGAGWHLGADTIAVRRQLVARSTLLALPRRAQRVAVRTNPFQRRAGLAAFDVVLATKRHGAVRHLDAATAGGLARAVASAATKRPPADVLRDLPLDFAAAPPE
jgi:putative membrane protein